MQEGVRCTKCNDTGRCEIVSSKTMILAKKAAEREETWAEVFATQGRDASRRPGSKSATLELFSRYGEDGMTWVKVRERYATLLVCCTCEDGDEVASVEMSAHTDRGETWVPMSTINPHWRPGRKVKLPSDWQPMRVDHPHAIPVAYGDIDRDVMPKVEAWARSYIAKRDANRAATEAPYQTLRDWNDGEF